MTLEERKKFVDELTADFQKAKDGNCQDVAVWMNLAWRYFEISANMNFAFCVERARGCPANTRLEPHYAELEAVA